MSAPRKVLYRVLSDLKPKRDVCRNGAADLQAVQQQTLLKANVFAINIGIE